MLKKILFITTLILITSCGSSKEKCSAYGDLNEDIERENII